MPCASPSVSLPRSLRRWLEDELVVLAAAAAVSATACQADRYRKHFTSFQHLCLLLAHGLSGSPSLWETYRSFPGLAGLAARSGLVDPADPERVGVSYPQLAASNTTRPAAFVGDLVPSLIARAQSRLGLPGIPCDLHILDATFLPLSLLRAPWLTLERGVQIQLLYAPATTTPERVVVPAEPRHNDYQGMDELLLADAALLAALADETVVVDRGYYSTVRFHQLREAGIHIITRRHPQAHIEVEENRPRQPALPLPESRIRVRADQRITVGSPTYRKCPPLQGWRLVTATVQPTAKARKRGAKAVVYEILTDRWDLSAHQVVCGYLFRWQIELFFRWIKRQLGLMRPLGYSRNAVLLSLWLCLVVHLLLTLAAALAGSLRPSAAVRSALKVALIRLTLPPPPI